MRKTDRICNKIDFVNNTKKCPVCKNVLPFSEFKKKDGRPFGYCKDCCREFHRKWYKRNLHTLGMRGENNIINRTKAPEWMVRQMELMYERTLALMMIEGRKVSHNGPAKAKLRSTR